MGALLFIAVLIGLGVAYGWSRRDTRPVFDPPVGVTATERAMYDVQPYWYSVVKRAVAEGDASILFPLHECSIDEMDAIVSYVIEHSPFETYVDTWTLSDDESEGELELAYELPARSIDTQRAYVKRAVERIVADVPDEATEAEQVKFVYDAILSFATYDEETADRLEGNDSYGYTLANTAYGLLVEQTGVCEGFARLFVQLFDALGLDNYYVIGENEKEGHAWNLVRVDGAYYYLDATTDAPVPGDVRDVTYEDFLVPASDLPYTWNVSDYPPSAPVRHPIVS